MSRLVGSFCCCEMFYFETITSIGKVKLSKRSVFYEGEYKMSEAIKLTPEDIQIIKTDIDEATKLVKHYAVQYEGKEHYDHLGASCVM
jgi:hypothetical protein